MDLKNYYRKIREIEAGIDGECAVIVSRETPQGGRPGLLVEAPRLVAARMIAEGTADLATAKQAEAFRHELREAHAEEERRRAAARIQVSVISEADARRITQKERSQKSEVRS